MRVLLFGFAPPKFTTAYRGQIQEIAPDLELVVTQDREEIVRVLDEIEIAACAFPHDLITQARHLRWYQLWSAGADWLLRYPEVAAHDVMITTTSGIHDSDVRTSVRVVIRIGQGGTSRYSPTESACLERSQEYPGV